MNSREPIIAVSMGDPAGIGPDIIINAWSRFAGSLPRFFVIGCPKVLEQRAKMLGVEIPTCDFSDPHHDHLPVMPSSTSAKGLPGDPTADDGRVTIEAIEKGVASIREGIADALVTCPINKKALYATGFAHPGHTEFLGELATRHYGGSFMPVMMIAGPGLKTVPVTIHVPLMEVSRHLSIELIVKTVSVVQADLVARFNLASPKIALAGLNPHAGEQGSIGGEDELIVRPAADMLRDRGIDVVGPLPADTMFHEKARTAYDVAVCMYHDQALIPAKMLGFDEAVNVTLGLPFIRTSPDHGTAYDIAGTGAANPSSFIAALHMANDMATRR